MQPNVFIVSSDPLYFVLWELGLGEPMRNANSLAIDNAMSDKYVFVSDSELSCLIPTFIKLWKANCYLTSRVKAHTLPSS